MLAGESAASQTFGSEQPTKTGRRIPGASIMSPAVLAGTTRPAAIPLREIIPWLLFGGVLSLLALYFVGVEQGAAALFPGSLVHEYVHDGRHLLGFPCH